jgi:hypothetical protein
VVSSASRLYDESLIRKSGGCRVCDLSQAIDNLPMEGGSEQLSRGFEAGPRVVRTPAQLWCRCRHNTPEYCAHRWEFRITTDGLT